METTRDFKRDHESTHKNILVLVLFTLFVSLMVNVWQFSQPNGRVSCADFGSYADMLDAYKNGAQWLNGDPWNDDVPCESYLPI